MIVPYKVAGKTQSGYPNRALNNTQHSVSSMCLWCDCDHFVCTCAVSFSPYDEGRVFCFGEVF